MCTPSNQTIWLARHGTRKDRADPGWAATAERPFDPHLADVGVEEAHRLAARLIGARLDAVYASPFLRTLQTAAPIAEATGAVLRIEPGLCEWLRADWFNATPWLIPHVEHAWRCAWLDEDYRSPVIMRYPETWEGAIERSRQTIRRLAATGESFVAVGHGASVIGMLAGLRDVEPEYDAPPPPLASLFQLVRNGDGWRLMLEADTSHLDEGHAGRKWSAMTRSRGMALLPPTPPDTA